MIGIIDVDILIYRACAKAEKESANVITVFDDMLERLEMNAACTSYSYHLSGKGNFRKNLKQGFTNYKGKRKGKPINYFLIRDYVSRKYDCISVPLFEADDTIAIEVTNHRKNKQLFTIVSVDKDLIQLGGLYHNISYGSVKVHSIEQGIQHFHRQLITGDSVDNIPGIEGMGKVKAEKLLKGKSVGEEFNSVIRAYKKHYPNDYFERLNTMGTMLWLKRSYEEKHWNIESHKAYLNPTKAVVKTTNWKNAVWSFYGK